MTILFGLMVASQPYPQSLTTSLSAPRTEELSFHSSKEQKDESGGKW